MQVHKAGSTTIYNMLARYAFNHNLNVALPETNSGRMCRHTFASIRKEQVLPLAPGQSYHMLFSHMKYNRSAIERFMPKDAFYVAIMRDPLQRYLSGVYYFRRLKPPTQNNSSNQSFKAFLNNTKIQTRFEGDCRFHNSILCDTGLPLPLQRNVTAVKQHLKKLDRELDLMLVMEYFAESLVLFKRRACLQLKDVLYFKTNSRKNVRQHQILEDDVAAFRALQKGDYLAYEHFYSKFWEEVRKEGAGFHQEVSHFNNVSSRVWKYCADTSVFDTLVVPTSDWNEEFIVNDRDCLLMKTAEVKLHGLLVKRAVERRDALGYRDTRKEIPKWKPTC